MLVILMQRPVNTLSAIVIKKNSKKVLTKKSILDIINISNEREVIIMREQKLEIINRLIAKGYQLCGRTAEQMADMLSLETWQSIEQKYTEYHNSLVG